MKFKQLLTFAATLLVSPGVLAAGSLKQAYVSTSGLDATGCGRAGAPCRTFQYALNNAVAPGGVLYVAKPGNYAPARIAQSVTIINASGGTAGITEFPAFFTGFSIVAPFSDRVTLQGLTIDGSGSGASSTAVAVTSGVANIVDCDIKNIGTGLVASNGAGTDASLNIYNTRIARISGTAVALGSAGRGSVRGSIYRLSVAGARIGLDANIPGSAMNVRDSVFTATQTALFGTIAADGVKAAANDKGFVPREQNSIMGAARSALSRSTLVGNRIGLELNNSMPTNTPQTFQTYKDSVIEGNSGGDLVGDTTNVQTKLKL